MQILLTFNSKLGKTVWEFGDHAIKSEVMSIYAPQITHDVNGDGIPEILSVHGGNDILDSGKQHGSQ